MGHFKVIAMTRVCWEKRDSRTAVETEVEQCMCCAKCKQDGYVPNHTPESNFEVAPCYYFPPQALRETNAQNLPSNYFEGTEL